MAVGHPALLHGGAEGALPPVRHGHGARPRRRLQEPPGACIVVMRMPPPPQKRKHWVQGGRDSLTNHARTLHHACIQGLHGATKLNIHKLHGQVDKLPVSHTYVVVASIMQ